jgi:Novel STAND NTPase 1
VICNAEPQAVRQVVDAFRAAGCNFLMPEIDAAHPMPLADDSIIDISHESLIRQWRRLAQWVEAEARARRQWRRLVDRFEDRQPLNAAELGGILPWLAEHKPSAAWARRSGGDFAAIMDFVRDSERARRKFAPAIMPLFGLAALCISFVFGLGFWTVFSKSPVPWYVGHVCGSVAAATTCAFGLWLYLGFGVRRAVIAAGVIFALIVAAGAIFIEALMWRGLDANIAGYFWNVTLAAPCVVGSIAIFERSFRRLSIWLLLVLTYSVPIHLASTLTGNPGGSLFLYVAAWSLWCAVFGSQLRRIGNVFDSGPRRHRFEALKLGLMTFGLYYISAIWLVAIWAIAYGAIRPSWPWQNDIIVYSGTLAITFAFGLRRYRGMTAKLATLAAITIFLLEFTPAAIIEATLLPRGVPALQALHWAAATTIAPAAAIGLALFDRDFRKPVVWLPQVALFTVPYGTLVWLYDAHLISMSGALVTLLAVLFGAIWITAIGYRLQRHAAPPAPSSPPPAKAEQNRLQAPRSAELPSSGLSRARP